MARDDHRTRSSIIGQCVLSMNAMFLFSCNMLFHVLTFELCFLNESFCFFSLALYTLGHPHTICLGICITLWHEKYEVETYTNITCCLVGVPTVPAPSCSEREFQCQDDKRCIDARRVCDKYPDCSDGSDERNCGKQ